MTLILQGRAVPGPRNSCRHARLEVPINVALKPTHGKLAARHDAAHTGHACVARRNASTLFVAAVVVGAVEWLVVSACPPAPSASAAASVLSLLCSHLKCASMSKHASKGSARAGKGDASALVVAVVGFGSVPTTTYGQAA